MLKIKRIIILSLVFVSSLFFFVNISLASAPKIFFSDFTDAPIAGWNGSATKGAAVSIWGINLGGSRGSSYVSVGGVNLTKSSDYAEWGVTTNPTTARELQRITFWLNSGMTTGDTTITVTTSEGSSNSIPFHTRTNGNIYFVARDGNDSNNGLSTSSPWLTWKKVRETADAGDVVYFRAGTWAEIDAYDGMLFLTGSSTNNTSWPHHSGSEDNSINFASYPGELAQMGNGSTDHFMERYKSNWESYLGYWTFSKFKIEVADNVVMSSYNTIDDHIRWINIDYTTTTGSSGVGYAFSGYMNMTDYRIYGCYAHDCGQGDYGSSMYFGGGQSQYLDIGWNEFTTSHRQIQFYGHKETDCINEVHFHDNFVHDNHRVSVMMGGGDPASGVEYSFVKKGYIYNNIIAHNAGEMRIADGSKGTHGNFFIYNNTFYNNALATGTTFEFWIAETDSCVFKNNLIYAGNGSNAYFTYFSGSDANITGDHNCWYGQGSGPAWDSNSLDNMNPHFVSENPVNFSDFRLKSDSPCKNQGTSTVSPIVTNDIGGISRPQGDGYDIGAYEYNQGTVPPPPVDDTTPPTGSIMINSGAAETENAAVTLNLSASDSESGVSQMQLSNNNADWSSPETYATSKSWSLSAGLGTKTVYVKYRDGSGNWSVVYSDTIELVDGTPAPDTTPPAAPTGLGVH